MKLNTLSLSLSFISSLLLVSCGGRQERDSLKELLLDYQTRIAPYTLSCFDESSADSTFITLFITRKDGDSVSITLLNGGLHLLLGYLAPPLPPPPSLSAEESNQIMLENERYIQHLRDSLGHPYAPDLRGMICEGRLRVLVYGDPETVSSFVSGHKLLYNPDIFRYMAYKDEERFGWDFDLSAWYYTLLDQSGHFRYERRGRL